MDNQNFLAHIELYEIALKVFGLYMIQVVAEALSPEEDESPNQMLTRKRYKF